MFKQYYNLHNFCFSISTDCEDLISCLRLLYPALAVNSGRPSTGWSVSRFHEGGRGPCTFRLYEAEGLIFETDDRVRLLDNLEWAVMARILQKTRHFVQLHAAGVAADGAALILVGPSGAGKTSLALGLLLQGWKCLSDEVILLDPADNLITPLPRNFHTDPRTMSLFPGITARLNGPVCVDGSGKVRVDPALARRNWVAGPSAPAWLVFPRYSPGNANDLIPIGETEAMTLLIGQTINLVDHAEEGLEVLLRLVRNCLCYRFNTGNIHEASLVMSALMKQQAPLGSAATGGLHFDWTGHLGSKMEEVIGHV